MNVNDVDMNGEASGSSTDQSKERLSNSPKHNDCGKHCGVAVGGARPKIRHLVCNIPNGIDHFSDAEEDDAAKVNNNILHKDTSDEADNKSDSNLGISMSKVHNGLNLNHSNGLESNVGIDSYLRNNVNFHSVVDKCPLKVRSCSDSDYCLDRFSASNSGYAKTKMHGFSDVGWRDNDSSSDTGNEGEDGLSDECCIYTYKGDQCADLPSSFFRLDALTSGDQIGTGEGSRCRRDGGDEGVHNSGSSSPEMDFLEMDFDPGPSCEQDSDDESDHEELAEEEAVPYPNAGNSVPDPAAELDCVVEHEARNDLNAVASSSNNDLDMACAASSSSSPEEQLPVVESVSRFVQSVPLSAQHRSIATCWPARDAWGHHCNSGDLCSPGDSTEADGEIWQETPALWNVGNMKIQGEGLPDTRKYNLHSALYHCIMAKRLVLDKQTSFSEIDDSNVEGSQDGLKSPLERVMIWSEPEACAKQVTQISTSACGATAVVNVLLALNIPFSLDRVKEGVATRVRAENASLPEYLFSRSVAGATHVDIIRGLEHASEGGLYSRFFHMYPARAISLTRWLAYWMKKGAIPIATLNLQNGVAPGNPVPDAWHHQMVFGVGPRGVYLTNPLERVNEGALWPQLCSPSVLLVRRNDVLSRWNEQVDLRPLMTIPDPHWKRSNVLGQVVNIIRESMNSRAQGQGRVVTQHISIPASYCSGITLTISRESPGYDELKNASELPLLQQD
ncbi:uncharacterized protein [Anabrus simplex]|uniref:uncharacterized protein n=1 Tax=Anabrus simplex TaxID=316456 RepID=UPI0035A3A475